MTAMSRSPSGAWRAAMMRAAGFLCLWLALAGAETGDLPIGLAAAALAAWVSLRLLPAGVGRARPLAAVGFAAGLLWRSVLAGWDVARRALDPRLPLRPGVLRFESRLAPGPARSTFCMLESLLPGTLPIGPGEDGALAIHCLDLDQPALEQMAADEAMFAAIVGEGGRNG